MGKGGAGLNAILDDLDSQMLEAFLGYAEEVTGAWEELAGSGNPGQQVIVTNHILEAVTEHVQLARKGWPRAANPDDYYEVVMSCFFPDVMARAFSDTIDETYSTMTEFWTEANEWQDEHDHVSNIMGAEPPPHSTESNWRGNSF